MKKNILLLFLLFTTLIQADVADKWKINVGTMFVTNFETDMQVTPKELPLAVRLNSKDQLGMENDTAIFRIDSYYRFTDTHSIDFTYFRVKSSGNRQINRDIEWDNTIISAGAQITSHFDMDIIKVNYLYSFYHNSDVELALSVGLHITAIDLGLGAKGTIDGVSSESYSSAQAATVPLPVIGFKGEYTIIKKRLFAKYKTDYFLLRYEGFQGSLVSSLLSLEYRFVDHVGVGLGYNANRIYLKADDGDKKLELSNNLNGALLYFTYVY